MLPSKFLLFRKFQLKDCAATLLQASAKKTLSKCSQRFDLVFPHEDVAVRTKFHHVA